MFGIFAKSKDSQPGAQAVRILDFDERVVISVRLFAERFRLSKRISAELYNVADPLPEKYWKTFQGFYTNPPFGASNRGMSIQAFLMRGIEAVGADAVGCIVLADHPSSSWSQDVLHETQKSVLNMGFWISELIPEFHRYHLDDTPDLTSCSLVIKRRNVPKERLRSKPLPQEMLNQFYGEEAPLKVHYVRDKTNGGKLASRDYELEPFFNT